MTAKVDVNLIQPFGNLHHTVVLLRWSQARNKLDLRQNIILAYVQSLLIILADFCYYPLKYQRVLKNTTVIVQCRCVLKAELLQLALVYILY